MSPETPVTPLIQNHLETAPVIIKPGNSNAGNVGHITEQNLNNHGWDTATEELLLSLDRQNLFPGLGENLSAMIDLDSDWVHAPLATPEVLSAASSMSVLSRTCSISKGEHKSESMSGRLEAIKQSPEIQSRSVSSAQNSVDDLADTLSEMDTIKIDRVPEYKTKDDLKMPQCKSIGDLLLQSGENGEVPMLDISKGSMANLLPSSEYETGAENVTIGKKQSVKSISFNPVINKIKSSPDFIDRTSKELNTTCIGIENTENNAGGNSNGNMICFQTCKVENEMENKGLYERHSPVETNQFGYANPNELYSAASIGYVPHYLEDMNGHSDDNLAVIDTKEDTKSSPRTPEKRLHYSQSESRLKGLSDQFQMRRSTEEGDIAHLEDTSTVFVGERLKKIFTHRESEPAFDKDLLPKRESRLEAVVEHQNSVPEQENGVNSLENTNTSPELDLLNKEPLRKNLEICVDVTNVDSGTEVDSDMTCLLNKDNMSISEERLDKNNLSSRNSLCSSRSSPGRTPEEEDIRLFHSQSCHSTFTSSVSGGSEQRLSLISANSEDFPIVETDV